MIKDVTLRYLTQLKHLLIIYFAYLLTVLLSSLCQSDQGNFDVSVNRTFKSNWLNKNSYHIVNWKLYDVLEKSRGDEYFEGWLHLDYTDVLVEEVTLVSVLCKGKSWNVSSLLLNVETVLKSLILFSNSDIHYILVINSEEFYQDVQHRLQPLILYDREQNPTRIIRISKRDVWYPDDYVSACSVLYTCADARLFLPSILPDLDKAIYVDVDFVFLQPIEKLWTLFQYFNQSQTFGFAFFDLESFSIYLEYFLADYDEKNNISGKAEMYPPFNSGLMMMELGKVRRIVTDWSRVIHNITLAWDNKEPILCDQMMLHLYFYLYREQLFIVPCEWNFRNKIFSMNELLPRGPFPHFTSELKCNRVFKRGIAALHFAGQLASDNRTYGYQIFQCFARLSLKGSRYKLLKILTDCLRTPLDEATEYTDINWSHEVYSNVLFKSIYEKRLQLLDDNSKICDNITENNLYI